jgi:hypothetical protein
VVWVGTEPSEVWRSADAGTTWEQTSRLETLSSSSEWSFAPRPDTHHVRWIACHPLERKRLWVAIEAGALVSTMDVGSTCATAFPVDRGTRTRSLFTAALPKSCACLLVMDISRPTTAVRRGVRRAAVSRSATCGAWLSIRGNRRSSWCQPRPDRTPRMWPVVRMAGCIVVLIASAGSASATASLSHPPQSRRCSAPGRRQENCGPRTSAACTVRMTVGKVGAAWPAMRRRRSTCAASRTE